MKRAAILVLAALAATAVVAETAAYRFALGKLQAAEGDWEEAAESFAGAVALAPDDPYLRIEYASFLLQIGRRQAALEQAVEARQLAPEDANALQVFARSQLAVADGDPEAVARAREAFEQLRRQRPQDLQSLIALGRLYLGGGQAEEAAEVFQQALERRPANGWLLSLLVEALLRADRSAEAERALKELLRVEPGEARARLTLADLQQKRGDARAAARTLREAPPEVTADLDYRRRLGFALYRSGDLGESLAVVESVLAEDGEDFGGRYLEGLIYAAEGHHERAAALLRQLVALRPQSLELALLAARVLERQRAIDDAVQLLRDLAERLRETGAEEEAALAEYQSLTVLSRADRYRELLAVTAPMVNRQAGELSLDLVFLHLDGLARTDRGEEALQQLAAFESPLLTDAGRLAKEAEILFELGRDETASARIRQLLEMPGGDARLEAARLLQSRERYAEAIPILEGLGREDADEVQLLFWLGAAYERTGRHAEAEAAFQRLLEIDDSFAPALNYLGYMWAELGRNLDQARELAERAVALEPDNGAYVDSLGWALFRLGQFEQARLLLERAARLVPEDAVIYEHLGDLYLAVGQPAVARRHYERALSLDGENAETVSGKLDRLRPQL